MSSHEHAGRIPSVPAAGQTAAPAPRKSADLLSSVRGAKRPAAIHLSTEIRPDVVARARALAADPSYPGAAIMKHIAKRILAATELTEGEC